MANRIGTESSPTVKAGGRNDHIGNNPVYLNQPLHILEQMYTRGFSAVVDASKFSISFRSTL